MTTYLVYIKPNGVETKIIKVKATGYVLSSDGKTISFDSADKRVAMFNFAEIIGFVRADAVEN